MLARMPTNMAPFALNMALCAIVLRGAWYYLFIKKQQTWFTQKETNKRR